jgi:hypothetical protein
VRRNTDWRVSLEGAVMVGNRGVGIQGDMKGMKPKWLGQLHGQGGVVQVSIVCRTMVTWDTDWVHGPKMRRDMEEATCVHAGWVQDQQGKIGMKAARLHAPGSGVQCVQTWARCACTQAGCMCRVEHACIYV